MANGALAGMGDAAPVSAETTDFMIDLVTLDADWTGFGAALDGLLASGVAVAVRRLAMDLHIRLQGRGRARALPSGANLSTLDLRDTIWSAETLDAVDLTGANLLSSSYEAG